MKYLIIPMEDVLNLSMTLEPGAVLKCEMETYTDRMGTIDLVDPVYEKGAWQWPNCLTPPCMLPPKKN